MSWLSKLMKPKKPTVRSVATAAVKVAQAASAPRAVPTGVMLDDRHMPPGKWSKFSLAEKVAGVHHHRDAVETFIQEAAAAKRQGRQYGVTLKPDPTNGHDKRAVQVVDRVSKAVLGYLPATLAAEVHHELIEPGLPFDAELYRVFRSDDGFIDITVIVLGLPGHSMKTRMRRARSAGSSN